MYFMQTEITCKPLQGVRQGGCLHVLQAHHLNCIAEATCGNPYLMKCSCCACMPQISPSGGLALCVSTAPHNPLKCTCC